MLIAFLIFLFVLYCILERFKYNKPEFEESVTRFKKKASLKEVKTLNKKIVYLKFFIFILFSALLIVNHFLDPLSKSAGIKGLIILLLVTLVIWIICVRDIYIIRRSSNEKS